MRDMRAVETVEAVLVDVLGVHPEEVLPYARVQEDLGAGDAEVAEILRRLRLVLPADALARLTASRAAGPSGSFPVAALVDLVEAKTRYRQAALPQLAA